MKELHRPMTIALAALIFLGFFLPWVSVESEQAGWFTKIISGKSQEKIATISGFQVPIMANSEESRLIITIAKIFNPGIEGVDKKSFAIWIIPVLAIIFALLVHFLEKDKWVNLAIGVIGVLIFVIAVFKIQTTDLDKAILRVRIGLGLWLILWSYLIMGILCLVRFKELIKSES